MVNWNFNILVFLIVLFPAASETNSITYFDLTLKDLTVNQLEDLYYLKVSKSVRLTGENLFDFNNFSGIQRVRTYTTIKIEF
jgi:hypothetical protein